MDESIEFIKNWDEQNVSKTDNTECPFGDACMLKNTFSMQAFCWTSSSPFQKQEISLAFKKWIYMLYTKQSMQFKNNSG